METITKEEHIPQTDSIEELAAFWQSHDVTDFEDELEEVTTPVFVREQVAGNASVQIELPVKEFAALQRIAEEQHKDYQALAQSWVLEKLYYVEMMRRTVQEFRDS
ncbi:MAG: hypothetical protein KDE19_24640 [Caldilineaceae bacterium]|nr:hypothetical protein [Caldilineaceae bacterium]